MTLTRFPELTKLPKRQRLKLAEELWFSGVDDSIPVDSLAKRLLDERWKAYRAGKAKRISLNELERRLSSGKPVDRVRRDNADFRTVSATGHDIKGVTFLL